MYVSLESQAEIESRLLSLLGMAEWHFFEEPFSFVESTEANRAKDCTPSTLAWVTDGQVDSFLRPSDKDSKECFGLFRVHFPPGRDNSGFVGWLANRLKVCCGTGVFVICGSNSSRGGIFDYWGYPVAMKENVLSELRSLGVNDATEKDLLAQFDRKEFRVTSSDPNGEANAETNFRFRQFDSIVEANYEGGPVRCGKLIGILRGKEITYKYLQANVHGQIRTGQATTTISRIPSGKLRLEEHYTWDGVTDGSTGVLVLEEL